MTKESPQFKLRLTPELKSRIQQAAKESHRSYNAEICHRLELTFLYETPRHEFIPAQQTRELIALGRRDLPIRIRKRIQQAITEAIDQLKTFIYVDLSSLNLTTFNERDLSDLISPILGELTAVGYEVVWDSGDSIWISVGEAADEENLQSDL